MKKIVITGGHLTPAQAVIAVLKKEGDWEIYYLGRRSSLTGSVLPSVESEVVPQLGVNFILMPAGRFQRQLGLQLIESLLKLILAFLYSLFLFLKIRPDLVLSFGGYVSLPPVTAAWLLGIPIFIHEQTVVYGLANKINSFFAKKIFVSFPESLGYFPKRKTILTGNPIREEIFSHRSSTINNQLSGENLPLVYITGGNQGSRVINQAVAEALPQLLRQYRIIHQCGKWDYKKLSAKIGKRYFLTDYVGLKDIGWVLRNADLVISRAGANIIYELAALGKPAILIPISWSSQDEQNKNSQILKNIGLVEILPQSDLSATTLLFKVNTMMAHLSQYKKAGQKAKQIVIIGAAHKIVDEMKK